MSEQPFEVGFHRWQAGRYDVTHRGPCTWENCKQYHEAMLAEQADEACNGRSSLTELMEPAK